MDERYLARGASAGKEDVHAAIASVDRGIFPQAFCKILPDLAAGDGDYCTIMHADGAGTKSALAWAYWKHTGDLSVWRGIAQDSVVMNTDDLLCVGCTGPMLLSSSIGRNKRLVPGEVIKALIEGTESTLEMLRAHGLDITSCGGETADLGDLVRTIVVDSTVFARMPRRDVIDNGNLRPGLAVVGLASYGKAAYEEEVNSGIGSNGLTSARHDLLGAQVQHAYPDTFDPGLRPDLVYSGPYSLTQIMRGTEMPVGKALLSPTRTYTPVLLEAFRQLKSRIVGLVHCTGGGQTKVLHFIPNEKLTVVKDKLLPVPPIFREIYRVTETEPEEMYKVFNMGHRMEAYIEPEAAQDLIAIARSFGIESAVVGRTEEFRGHRLEIWHEGKPLIFS